MTGDDRLDPVLADRFRALDDVLPPDTWPRRQVSRTAPARWWPIAAAAAALAAFVGGVVVLGGGDDEGSIVGAPVTGPPTSALPPTTLALSDPPTSQVVEDALATAEPAIVRPGEPVTITPSRAVQRICTDIVDVLPASSGPILGQILAGSTWEAVPSGAAGPTWPACQGAFTDAGQTVIVPPVDEGDYRFCIAWEAEPDGCALVTVVGTAITPIEPRAVATPATVVAGSARLDRPGRGGPACVHRPGRGVRRRYVPSATSVVPASARRRAKVTPSRRVRATCPPIRSRRSCPTLAPGTYAFCASDDVLPEGCAAVEVRPSQLLATASPSEVATGDTVTITPSRPVRRACDGGIRVFDATLTTPVVDVTDPATGASGAPASNGGTTFDCGPSSAEPLTSTVPDLLLGAYAFCLSADPVGDSCALVFITAQRFTEPTVPPGSVPPGPSTAPPSGPVVISDGAFLGIGWGSHDDRGGRGGAREHGRDHRGGTTVVGVRVSDRSASG
jgi:hypothetical protein